MRRILPILALAATIMFTGCSADTGSVKVAGGLCESHVATAARTTDQVARTASFDKAIKSCRTLEQWQGAVATYAAAVTGLEPLAYLGARCADPGAGLNGYMLCGLLAASLVTPSPEPTRKSRKKHKKTPKPAASAAPSPSLPGVGLTADS